jgi:hypothetical protein
MFRPKKGNPQRYKRNKIQNSAVRWNQIRRRIKTMHEGDNPSFRNEFITIHFFLQLIFQVCTAVLSYWALKTLRDLQSTNRGLDPVAKNKKYTIPILMHYMHISITYIYISSVMFRLKINWKSKGL